MSYSAVQRHSDRLAKAILILAVSASIVTLLLMSIGSFVRVSGSGLACPDWPLCHGQLIPPLEYHVLIEYSHRLTALLVSTLTLSLFVLTVLGTITRHAAAQRVFVPASFAMGFLAVEVVLGGITVLTELPPPVVTLHLATAEGVFASLLVTSVWAFQGQARPSPASAVVPLDEANRLFRWALYGAGATYLVIVSGAYVVASAATVSCGGGFSAWPLCDGSLIPDTHLEGIHVAHRIVVLLGAAVVFQAVRLAWRQRERSRGMARIALIGAHLLAAQIIVGALIPWTRFEHLPRVLHITLATATWGAMVVLAVMAARHRSAAAELAGVAPGSSGRRTASGLMADLFWLTKPRVMVLLLVTAFGGMVLAAQGLPPLTVAIAVLLGGALASGGAGAINQGLEGSLDSAMLRTRHRPVANGRIRSTEAILYGVILNVLAFAVLAVGANVLAGLLAIGGSLFYVFIYTMWLKRSTVQNIVIGGAAGAVPPMVGWAGVTGALDLPAFYLFAIIFFWTPPHFWALALLIQDDYARAKVPMMPVVEGEERTRWAILLYTVLVNVLAILFFLSTRSLGVIYLAGTLLLGSLFVYYAVRLMQEKHRLAALRLYKYSLLYLALFFLVVMVDGAF
jgi:protoheme IX farnesyltransferase